jgi:hypothetical protein
MGPCNHPECRENARRRLFIGESVFEYCMDHYEEASAELQRQSQNPQWESADQH